MAICFVFDVNETLLDLAALDEAFEEAFGTAQARHDWFSLVLRTGMTNSITGHYHAFAHIGAAALEMISRANAVELSEDRRSKILGGMRDLPPYPDAPRALVRLRAAGYKLATLTNSALPVADEQVSNAGLSLYFDEILSADLYKHLKPATEVYRRAAADLDVAPEKVWMIAAHDWDVAGAMAAGCHGALIDRSGTGPNPLFPRPDIISTNLDDIAQTIIRLDIR